MKSMNVRVSGLSRTSSLHVVLNLVDVEVGGRHSMKLTEPLLAPSRT
jgi:hypothetical protein